MTSQTINTKLRILAPDDGYALTDGTTYTTGTIYLGWNADASRWHEIPESEIPDQSQQTPVRAYSKLKIVAALQTAGVWSTVKQALESEGLYDLFLAAQVFADDNEFFERGKTQLQALLGWTDNQVQEILDAALI